METLQNKKLIIYFVLGLLVLAVLGFAVYQYLLPVITEELATTGEERSGGRLPSTPGGRQTPAEEAQGNGEEKLEAPAGLEEKLFPIAGFSTISASLNKKEDKVLFYKKDGGDLLSDDFGGGNQEKISNLTILGLVEAIWSPVHDRAAVFYLDGETLKGFLHIGTSSVSTLPQDIRSLSWSPDGKSFAYTLLKDERASLVIADSSGKNHRAVANLPVLDAQLAWISSDKIALQTAPSGLADGFVFLYSRSAGTLTKILGPLRGLASRWSPDGSKVLVASTDATGANLKTALYDAAGKNLPFPEIKTLPQKCVFADAKELYCAVPNAFLPNSLWPDDYLRGELNTSDRIVRITPEKNLVESVLDEGDFDVSELIVTKARDWLFFINRKDGSLWALKLK